MSTAVRIHLWWRASWTGGRCDFVNFHRSGAAIAGGLRLVLCGVLFASFV